MYKTKLQELCQERYWKLPAYSSVKHGPDHYASFKATVVVNGSSFLSSIKCTSSKDATNDAAKCAYIHFTTTPYEENVQKEGFYNYTEIDWDALFENNVQSSYKSRLQNHAQKNNISLPFYSHVRDTAAPQAPCYKAVVNIDGQSFESPQWYGTIKEAEQASAKAALSAIVPNDHIDHHNDSGFYKNLLQGLAQKRDLNLPMYRTTRFGHPPNLTYVCSVDVNGEKFSGEIERSKKQAEIMAAKAAYVALLERKMSETTISNVEEVRRDGELNSPASAKETSLPDAPGAEQWDGSYLLGGRVRVYTSLPDSSIFPKDVTILPVDENKWVAVGLELSA